MFWHKRIYLDVAAGMSANSSSPHEEGRRAKLMLEDARTKIARLVEVQADDVIFTSGATEANALAILGTVRVRKLQFATRKLHMLYLPSAHASIVENAKLLEREGVIVEPLPIKNAQVDCGAFAKMLRAETVLVSMEAVCGETGVVWNTREVAETIRKTQNKKGIFSLARGTAATRLKNTFSVLLHVDASQAPLTEKISRAHFGADLLVFDASKVGQTRGIGALVAHLPLRDFRREAHSLAPLYAGGGQERGLRPGSEAPELAREFATALQVAVRGREPFRSTSERMRAELIRTIIRTIPNISINEGPKNIKSQAPHILNISLPGRDTDYLVALLGEVGFAVSTKSACETDSGEGSRAVYALTGDRARAESTLRISWGPGIRSGDLNRFARALQEAVAFIDRSGSR